MYRRLLTLLLAFVLAWFFAPALSDLFSAVLPAFSSATVPLADYATGQSKEFYAHVILWTIILFFLLLVLRFVFGGIAPHAQRYGTTKPLRRVHGFTTELLAVTMLFLLATVIFGLLVNTKKKEIKRFIEANSSSTTFTNGVIPSEREIEAQWMAVANPADAIMEQSRAQLTNYLDLLTSRSVKIPSDAYHPSEDAYDELAKAIKARNEAAFLREANARLSSPALSDKGSNQPVSAPSEYLNIRSNYMAALTKKRAAAVKASKLKWEVNQAVTEFGSLEKEVERRFAAVSWWRKYLLFPLPYIWGRALFSACLLWFLAHVLFKAEISGIHHVILRFLEEGRFGQGGSGRFAGMFEEWGVLSRYTDPGATLSLILSPFGKQQVGQKFGEWFAKKNRTRGTISSQELFMGRSLYNPFLSIGLSDDRHMLTIAPSRTGKGATVIIPNLLLWEGSAIVIDPKGTNAAVTANRRRAMGQKVHLVDPFGLVAKEESERACFNPLESLDPNSDTIREDIAVLADALVVPDQDTKEKHWDDGARTVLSGLIGELITAYENPELPMLRDLLALEPEKQDELWARMFLNPGAGDAPRDAASRIIRGAGTNEISGLISNADKHTEWLSSPTMRKTFSKSTFRFADLKEQPTTIYLILPPQLLATHNRFLRLFINMAILQMSVGGRSKIPVLMVLDEFLALGHMAEVEKALGLMAGYNFVLWPIVQDLARLQDLYKNSVHSFIANSRAVQVFGVKDTATTEYISKQLGNSPPSLLASGKVNAFAPLRSPDEVEKDVSRASNRQYILRAGEAPLVLEKVAYYKGGLFGGKYPGLFHGKYDPDPDHTK